ncbi:MAG TPA: DUF4126 domain-containing protein [Thermoanaerobaculia bacterium]|jgi:hypothetical protein|nr:DUF4126 domain-containing protein [Thermoanaerobaculia bacterium]
MTSMLASLLTSVGLGAGAGVNSYATLLVFGLLSRWRPGMFPGELAGFFARTPVLIVVGVLYTIEFVADKVPAVDHVWDVIHTFIRPLAGALVAWAAAAPGVPRGVVILAAVLGGVAALTTHGAKASLRVASTATTAGTANPILSLVEDLFAFLNAFVAIFLPWLALLALVLVVLAVWRFRRRNLMSAGRHQM